MTQTFKRKDSVMVDTSALFGSPQKTGRTIQCTVLLPSPANDDSVYVAVKNSAPLYVSKSRITENKGAT